MEGPDVDLAVGEQLLVQLLPAPQARVHDAQRLARSCDHPPGNVFDAHRPAHVEHQRLARQSDRPGLDDQLARLGNRHEEAGDLGIGDRDVVAGLDLRAERVQHRPAAAEHVAESDGQERAVRVLREVGRQLLGQPLRVAERAYRVRGLVGGDVDERLHVAVAGGLQHVERSDDVALPRLVREALEQRKVLERRGVEHHLRTVPGERLAYGVGIAKIGQREHRRIEQPVSVYGQLDCVQRGLVTVEKHQLGRAERMDLAGQLRTDRPTGAGHQHPFARQVAGGDRHVGIDGMPADHVEDVDLAHLGQPHTSADERVERGHDQAAQTGLGGGVRQRADQRRVSPPDRDEHAGRAGAGGGLGQ